MPWGYIKDISPHVLKPYDPRSPEPLDYNILKTIYFELPAKPRTSQLTQDPLQPLAPDVLEPLKHFKEL